DTSLYAVLLRGIGILPMISSNHGQDARATSLQNRGNRCKELRRKRSKDAMTGRPHGVGKGAVVAGDPHTADRLATLQGPCGA
ncbi:MAG: hypothetical protein ACKOKC_16335, partial [Chthoniobacterales bacterium]